jgi:hypothetical protein
MLALSHPAVHADALMRLPDARGFVIRDKRSFASTIMPKYFGDRSSGVLKYNSFTRKLNRWGYVRVSVLPRVFQEGHGRVRIGGDEAGEERGGGVGMGGAATAVVRRGVRRQRKWEEGERGRRMVG